MYATDTDFAVEKQLAEMNKQRADLGLPPMGPDFVCELSEPSPKSSQSKTSDYEDIPATPLSGFESGVAVGLGDEKPFAEDFEQDSPATRNA